jgi:hypothetical protein
MVIRCIGPGAEDHLSEPFNPTLAAARAKAVCEKKFLPVDSRPHPAFFRGRRLSSIPKP